MRCIDIIFSAQVVPSAAAAPLLRVPTQVVASAVAGALAQVVVAAATSEAKGVQEASLIYK